MAEFNMYTAKMADLSRVIGSDAKLYLDKVHEVTSLINGLSAYWSGPTYDAFKAAYDSHLANIEELSDILKEYANKIEETADSGSQMINKINNIINY